MRRHDLDPISLVFGVAFLLLGLVFLVGGADVTSLGPGWIWPLPLIAVGALIVASAARRERRAR
jgi:hypothetical protein